MKTKNILLGFIFHIVSLVLGITFIFLITNTKNSNLSSKDYSTEETSNVSSFISNSKDFKQEDFDQLEDFFEDLFEERNDAIKDGNIEKLYKYYDISKRDSASSLEREFKRIAYFRDWTIAKNALLDDVESEVTITSIKEKDGILNIILSEKFSFEFASNQTPKKKHEFTHTLLHTIKVKPLGNGHFIVLSDSYDDFLNSELDSYKFDLTEKILVPNTKS